MTTKEKFEQLKELELKAITKKELYSIQFEFDRLAASDPDGFEDAFIESANQTLKAAKQLKIKEQIKTYSIRLLFPLLLCDRGIFKATS